LLKRGSKGKQTSNKQRGALEWEMKTMGRKKERN
jgi:hypothetical protein